jgi:polysaccharide export outer membrane protein
MIRQLIRTLSQLGKRAARPLTFVVFLLLLGTAPLSAQFSGPRTLTNPVNNFPEPAATTDRNILYPPEHDLLLTSGDALSIKVFLQSEGTNNVRLGADGTVFLPLLGDVHLAGLSIRQAERFLAEKYVEGGIYINPQVTIEVTESPNANITLTGELHSIVPIPAGHRRLLDVLSTAGGFPATASHSITIHRPGVDQPIIVDLGIDPLNSQLADVPVFAGDNIVLSRIGSVFMMGSFKSPGTVALTAYAPLTLLQATAASGGLGLDGAYGDLRIIRTIGDHRTVIKVNVHDVVYGKAPDPYLLPNDIVFLPSNPIKAALYNGTLGTFLGIFGLAYGLIH